MKHAIPPSSENYSRVDDYFISGDVVEIEREGADVDGEPFDPIELEIRYSGDDFVTSSLQVYRTKTGFVMGYLVYDSDGESPESPNIDGAGMIGTCNRRDSRELNECFQEALGLTSDWERKVTGWDILDEINNDVFADRPEKSWRDLLREPVADAYDQPEPRRDALKITYRRKWDHYVAEHAANGDFGDPDRVMLSVYEHGGRVYSVGDGSHFVDQQWDVSSGGAVWVPDDALREEAKGLTGEARRAKMEEWAGQLVESMNNWMNGAVYGVIVHTFDLDGTLQEDNVEECWGFIGTDYAEEELAREIRWELMTPSERIAEREKNEAENRARMEAYRKEHA